MLMNQLTDFCEDKCQSFLLKMNCRFKAISIKIKATIIWGNWQANSKVHMETTICENTQATHEKE